MAACAISVTAMTLLGCDQPKESVDLPQIQATGTLRAITSYSSTSYFLYRGQPMGFEYELLNGLAEDLELNLEIVIAHNLDSLTPMLLRGDGDLIAHGLTITKERQRDLAFTDHHMTTRQVLVQRKPDNWRDMKLHNIERSLIRDPVELIGREVHVRRQSSYYQRLVHLSEEIGGDIDIVTAAGDLETEELIRRVAKGEIEFTVADKHIAQSSAAYYRNLDVTTSLSTGQRIAWAVRWDSPLLLAAVNDWLARTKQSEQYDILRAKYFKNQRRSRRLARAKERLEKGQLSVYDDLIKAEAERLGWDWRLLAAVVYQESQFDPESESWAGAQGLMQLMPVTAESYGVTDPADPAQSLQAGVSHLKYLDGLFTDIGADKERRRFVLAAYNCGENHVADARRLTEARGGNAGRWYGDVAEVLLQLDDPEFYRDSLARYGYCRGDEPYQYVAAIEQLYEHYHDITEHVARGH